MARKNKYLELQGELEKYLSTKQAGSALPGENELSVKFKVSRPTLRRALSELVNAGVITSYSIHYTKLYEGIPYAS